LPSALTSSLIFLPRFDLEAATGSCFTSSSAAWSFFVAFDDFVFALDGLAFLSEVLVLGVSSSSSSSLIAAFDFAFAPVLVFIFFFGAGSSSPSSEESSCLTALLDLPLAFFF
jgi:hypothetical protein